MTEDTYEKLTAAYEAAEAAHEAARAERHAYMPVLTAAREEHSRLLRQERLAEKDMLEAKARLTWGVKPGDPVWAIYTTYQGTERRTPAFYMGYKIHAYGVEIDLRPVKKDGTVSAAKKHIRHDRLEPRDPKDF